MTRQALAAALTLGVLLDELLGDPRRAHPVAAFGSAASALERACYADDRSRGAGFAAAAIVPLLVSGVAVDRRLAGRPVRRTAVLALACWTVIGGRSLRRVAAAIADRLSVGDLDGARSLLPSLCGRDPESLDAPGIVRATIESLAENTSDAVVAPLLWGAVAGLPGLIGYRAVNTLDAMVGHRSPRYARFGSASAVLDDIANFLPARLAGLLTVLLARCVAGDAAGGRRAWREDAAGHPSPNAGVCEATAAGVLGIQLGGRTVYAGRVESRPLLGDGRVPTVSDIPRAARLSRAVEFGALAVALLWIGARR